MTPTIAEALKALESLYDGATNALRAMEQSEADAAMAVVVAAIMRAEERDDAPESPGDHRAENAA